MPSASTAAKVAFYGVIVCWWWFGLTFWLRRRPHDRVQAARRDLTSYLGMALQAVGYFAVWWFPFLLHRGSPIGFQRPALAWILTLLALSIAAFSAAFVNAAARQLGKQWSLAARIVEDHDLIQDGPYRHVRNPIYAGMFGMLIATGLVVSPILPLLAGCVIFLLGTYIRVHLEERLLKQTFGQKFEDYKKRVPALIPGLW
ncbi:MAG: isoprenylcysteine carboxylmethyltransferase family protein [Terriglobales bacterium]|jgi:protein-S-isoprenylcysteine O-methyltransferase Ste14